MNYNILSINQSDLPEIAALNQEIFAGFYETPPYQLSDFEERLQDKNPLILVAKDDEDKIQGYCISYPQKDSFYVWIMGVSKAYRKQGIGGKLIEETIKHASNKEYKNIEVKSYNVSPDMLKLLISKGFLITNFNKSETADKYNTIYFSKEI